MAPIASFLAEETYSYLPGSKLDSVFLTDFPKVNPEWSSFGKVAEDFNRLLEVRSVAAKEMEELRRQKVIGSSLDAQLKMEVPQEIAKIMQTYDSHLREFFMDIEFH